ncbi:hypothetical protein ACET3Z_031003 [Daucus carota]
MVLTIPSSSIDKGKFSAFAGILNKPVVEAGAPLFAGVSSKEVLHLPVISSLEEFLLSAHVSAYSNFSVLVSVKDVLKALGIISHNPPGDSSIKTSMGSSFAV